MPISMFQMAVNAAKAREQADVVISIPVEIQEVIEVPEVLEIPVLPEVESEVINTPVIEKVEEIEEIKTIKKVTVPKRGK